MSSFSGDQNKGNVTYSYLNEDLKIVSFDKNKITDREANDFCDRTIALLMYNQNYLKIGDTLKLCKISNECDEYK
jgi:hypothetical protein